MSAPSDKRLVIVHVRDEVNTTLAGYRGREYTSPPQPRDHALALVALLLGRPPQPDNGEPHALWRCPVAGGRRTITLNDLPTDPRQANAKEPVTPNPSPAPQPQWRPPPHRLQRVVLALRLSLAPMIDLLSVVTGNPPLTTLAARAAQLALLAAIGPALALLALTA